MQGIVLLGQGFGNAQTNIDMLLRQTHNSTETRKLLPTIYGPQFKNVIGYDCFSQAVFDDVERVASMTQDPYYKEYIRHDPSKFADSENTKYVGLCTLPRFLRSYLPSSPSISKLYLH